MSIRTAAIIAEYNPFHSGHMYHISQTRHQLGADAIVAIMSGNFVQRGDCACLSKYARARMALLGGADLVIELPLPWAMSGAEKFAQGGIHLAESLGCVDMLSFGSESGDIELIKKVARLTGSSELSQIMREGLSRGGSFAAVRERAAEELLPGAGAVLRNPNDTLGVEYCRALMAINSRIEPCCIERRGAAHDSTDAAEHTSASLLRSRFDTICDSPYLSEYSREVMREAIDIQQAPALIDRLDKAILYRLRQMSVEELAALPDISEGLENRIYKCARTARSFGELCDSIKVKRYTHARIRRIILSALLGLTAEDGRGTPPYIRILGMSSTGRQVLGDAQPQLPIITRFADADSLDERGRRIFELECRASDIFALAMPSPAPCGADMTSKMIVL